MAAVRLRDVNCRYGAPMGRGQAHAINREIPIKFHVARVRLDSGGYDRGGAYWGIGAPLYQAYADVENPPAGWEECGSCGGEHPPSYRGDCRDDRFRYPWRVQWDADAITFYFRESGDREDVKDRVRQEYPNARFYR